MRSSSMTRILTMRDPNSNSKREPRSRPRPTLSWRRQFQKQRGETGETALRRGGHAKEGIDERLRLEILQVIGCFPHTDQPYGKLELIGDSNDNRSSGRAVERSEEHTSELQSP